MMDLTEQQFLRAVFCLSRAGKHIDMTTIAEAAGLSATRTAVALITLERAGLVDGERLRLTLRGLAAVAALLPDSRSERSERIRTRALLRQQGMRLAASPLGLGTFS